MGGCKWFPYNSMQLDIIKSQILHLLTKGGCLSPISLLCERFQEFQVEIVVAFSTPACETSRHKSSQSKSPENNRHPAWFDRQAHRKDDRWKQLSEWISHHRRHLREFTLKQDNHVSAVCLAIGILFVLDQEIYVTMGNLWMTVHRFSNSLTFSDNSTGS